MAEPTRFIIVTIGRTGSTRIRRLLDSHPEITCHGELLGEGLVHLARGDEGLLGRLRREREADPASFLVHRAFVPGGDRAPSRAVGLKVLCGQVVERYPAALERLRSDRDLHVIHLVRRNGLRRFISEWTVGAGLVRHSYSRDDAAPTIEPVRIPVEAVLADLERVEAERTRVEREFGRHPFLEIAYEDTLDDNGPMLRDAQAFLGVDPAPLSCDLRKSLPEDPRATVANLDEIVAALRGTRFGGMVADLA